VLAELVDQGVYEALMDDERRQAFCAAITATGLTMAEAMQGISVGGREVARALSRSRDEAPGMTVDELLGDAVDAGNAKR
jgi:hypothetical protein